MRSSIRNVVQSLLATSGAALLILAGCAVGPDYHRPATPVDTHYTNAGQPGLAEGQARGLELPLVERSIACYEEASRHGLGPTEVSAVSAYWAGRKAR